MKFINLLYLDIGFGYVLSIVALEIVGLYTVNFVKKHAHWQKYIQAEEAFQEMQEKKVGTVRVQKGL